MCGIFGMIGSKDAAKLTYLGLYALQHRGEESAGIVASDKGRVHKHSGMGLVSDVFNERIIKSLRGNIAVGHTRYSTTGSSTVKNIQPFLINHRGSNIAIAHNGNLINTAELRSEIEEKGSIFQTTMDSEIIAHLLVRSVGGSFEEQTVKALSRLAGAFSLVILFDGMLIGARDIHGFRPLCIGKLDNAYVLASETCALDLICAKYVRDVLPGEIVFIRNDRIESLYLPEKDKHSLCIFEYIYFARPDSDIFGNNVYLTRKRLGQQLAKEYPVDCDIVMPIPDSGNYAAMGFAEESGIPLEVGMIRNHYIGRTFIQPSQHTRDFRVRVKLNPIRSILKDKKVALIEDSIVRGTTSRSRVKTLREAGVKEIHMLVSCPPIISPCFYGIDFPSKKELIASRRSVEQIRDFIGLDSLKYLSLNGMLRAMLLPQEEFCTACFSGKYPTRLPKKFSKNMWEQKRNKKAFKK
ncbi:MAG: amidophosphoribosyltransferase [Candidatus Omnitrophica bacterium]|jgi:amidophosphoribosyltransferase|nr:amidophosphoribosyltransferase [Candidatus Omnitrophota bacterium]